MQKEFSNPLIPNLPIDIDASFGLAVDRNGHMIAILPQISFDAGYNFAERMWLRIYLNVLGELIIEKAPGKAREIAYELIGTELIPRLANLFNSLASDTKKNLNIVGRNVTVDVSSGVNGEGGIIVMSCPLIE